MKIAFKKSEVKDLIKISEENPAGVVPYTGKDWEKMLGPAHKERKEKGLTLVGDHGIYLMSNAKGQRKTKGVYKIAYCKECNPTKQDFDTWYDAKIKIFGGDDGCIFFELDTIKNWVENSNKEECFIDLKPSTAKLLY